MRHSSSALLVLLLAGCASARSQPEAPRLGTAAQSSGVIRLAEPRPESEPQKPLRGTVVARACQTGDRMPVARPGAEAAALAIPVVPGSTLLRSMPMPNACPVTAPALQKRVPTGYVPPEQTVTEP